MERAWKKRSGYLCNEMDRNERAGNDNKKTLFPKGRKTLATTTTPSRITSLSSYRRTPLLDRLRARFKHISSDGLARKKYSFGFGKPFHLKWHERTKWKHKEMERHERKGHESNWKDMSGHERKWIETKGRAVTINKTTPLLWGTFPHSLGAGLDFPLNENVDDKHILLILLLVDRGNGPTSSLDRILTKRGKDMKEKEVDAHVTTWIEMKGKAMTTKQKLSPKAWKSLVATTTPLRITSLGSYRRTPLHDRFRARFKKLFQLGVSQNLGSLST